MACCVVLAAGGYPGETRKGDEITDIEDAEGLSTGAVSVFRRNSTSSRAGRHDKVSAPMAGAFWT